MGNPRLHATPVGDKESGGVGGRPAAALADVSASAESAAVATCEEDATLPMAEWVEGRVGDWGCAGSGGSGRGGDGQRLWGRGLERGPDGAATERHKGPRNARTVVRATVRAPVTERVN